MIHSFDYPELAAARPCRRRAPTRRSRPRAPHALHMPSHIFTRLGMWQESIESKPRLGRHGAGLVGARTHPGATPRSMPCTRWTILEYAYLQTGQDAKARALVDSVERVTSFDSPAFQARVRAGGDSGSATRSSAAIEGCRRACGAARELSLGQVSVHGSPHPVRAGGGSGSIGKFADRAAGLVEARGDPDRAPGSEGIRLGDAGRDPAPRLRGVARASREEERRRARAHAFGGRPRGFDRIQFCHAGFGSRLGA